MAEQYQIYTTEAQVQTLINSILSGQRNSIGGVAGIGSNGQIDPKFVASTLGIGNGGAIGTSDSPPEDSVNRVFFPIATGTFTNFSAIAVDIDDGLNLIIGNDTDGFELVIVPIDISGKTNNTDFQRSLGKNLFNIDTVIVGFISTSTGAIATTADWLRSDYIDVDESTEYTISGLPSTSGKAIRYEDNTGTLISFESITSISNFTFTTPANCVRVTFTIKRNTDAVDSYLNVQMELGDTATTFEAYVANIKSVFGDGIRANSIEQGGETITSDKIGLHGYSSSPKTIKELDLQLESFTTNRPSVNLFNKETVIDGEFINTGDGSVSAVAGWARSALIPVTAGLQYTISGLESKSGKAIRWEDGSGGFISYDSFSTAVNNDPVTFTAPVGAVFATFTVKRDTDSGDYDTAMFEQNSEASSYEPYGIIYTVLKSNLPAITEVAPIKVSIDLGTDNSTKLEYSFGGNDYKITVAPFRTPNIEDSSIFEWINYTIDGVSQLDFFDENAPYRFLNETLGGNHGYLKTRIQTASHDKTWADVGSIWLVDSVEVVLVGVAGNFLDFLVRNTDTTFTGLSLTHVSGATNTGTITGTAYFVKDLFPVWKNHSIKMLVDGKELTPSTGVLYCEEISFVESYEILDRPSMILWFIANVGSVVEGQEYGGDSIVRTSYIYEFNAFGNCSIYVDFLALASINPFKDIMFNQNNKGASGIQYYIPHTVPFSHDGDTLDFRVPLDPDSVTITTDIDFDSSKTEATGILANRVVWVKSPFTYSCGLLPVQDSADSVRRTNASRKALELRASSRKIYLSTIDSASISTLAEGDYYSTIAFKNISVPKGLRTANHFIQTSQGDFAYLDWHTSGVDSIELPSFLVGRTFTVVQKSSNVTVLSKVSTNLISVKISSGGVYDFLILKFH